MPSILITGANRGIGLEFTVQYAAGNWRVFACCRSPEKAKVLNDLAASSQGKVSLHTLDVSRPESISSLANELTGQAIDILLNNAGIYGDEDHNDLGKVDYGKWGTAFVVNTLATMRMVEAFLENVSRSEKRLVASLSSKMGSIADNTSGGSYIYRSSKAALNAVVKSLSLDLKNRGIIAVALHPGWVQTDMGGENAPTPPQESVQGMRRVLERIQMIDSGKFLSYDGTEVPW